MVTHKRGKQPTLAREITENVAKDQKDLLNVLYHTEKVCFGALTADLVITDCWLWS